MAVDLTENSNNGTWLSGFSELATQVFNTITPYVITFLWSPVTEYPALSSSAYSGTYERVSFSSPPIFDSIQEGPSITFDFPYTAGGSVIPGNFDSQASTGFQRLSLRHGAAGCRDRGPRAVNLGDDAGWVRRSRLCRISRRAEEGRSSRHLSLARITRRAQRGARAGCFQV